MAERASVTQTVHATDKHKWQMNDGDDDRRLKEEMKHIEHMTKKNGPSGLINFASVYARVRTCIYFIHKIISIHTH